MSQTPSLRETIDAMLASNKVPRIGGQSLDPNEREDLTPVDRAFLESWRDHADDPIWPSTLVTIRTYYRPYTSYSWMVARALWANRMAEGADASVDIVLEQRRRSAGSVLIWQPKRGHLPTTSAGETR